MFAGGPLMDVTEARVSSDLAEVVPPQLASGYRAVCFYRTDDAYYIAMPEPGDFLFQDQLLALTGTASRRQLRCVRACGDQVLEAAGGTRKRSASQEAHAAGVDDMVVATVLNSERLRQVNPGRLDMEPKLFLDWCLYQGWLHKAADLHFEGIPGMGRVRMRVDGNMRVLARAPLPLMTGVVALGRDWAGPGCSGDAWVPGDGRFSFRLDQTVYDVRAATMMMGSGEYPFPKLELRLLSKEIRPLESMGFEDSVLKMLRRMSRMPQGMLVFTGPTNSGKTSTLYSLLKEINRPDINIQTVEDPIEISMSGVNQAAVNEKHGVTWAKLLRAALRQDPDVLLAGEIRDAETAGIAVQGAQTGHLVFTTLHTNSACAAVERLTGMGVEPFLLGSVLLGISGQRLVNRLCPRCRRPVKVTDVHRDVFGRAGCADFLGDVLYEPRGCEHCGHTGYAGLSLIMELFPVNDEVSRLVMQKVPSPDLEAYFRQKGCRTMFQDSLRQAAAGVVSLEHSRLYDRNWMFAA
ncbi:GspE/PulE family protein [Termitidicoccus mucosus]|uniref:GspE/PulE family protein n=1 Tax=Termitidicoccus mucosus TaxID=1184151 RepID=UPI0031835B70